ncbi:MAG: hypothetical protein ABSA71_12600 [Desulfomonilia bacterium]
MQDVRLIREGLDSILELQKQKIDEMDVFFLEYSHEQKKNQQNFIDTLNNFLAEHKRITDEAKSLYKDINNTTQEMSKLSFRHKESLSSVYDHFFLKVFGFAALGGLFSCVFLGVAYKFIFPFIHRLLG